LPFALARTCKPVVEDDGALEVLEEVDEVLLVLDETVEEDLLVVELVEEDCEKENY
jgi:hypothetical protein